MLDLTIVIIVHNERDFLIRCLESIYSQRTKLSFNTILVDNGSQDGAVDAAKERFPEINLIRNTKNRGVAFARNQGIVNAQGRYILLLDADTLVLPQAIDKLVEFMESHKDIGLLGPKLVDARGNLQFSCRRYHTILIPLLRRLSFLPFIVRSALFKRYHMQDWNHSEVKEVEHIIGACQLIRQDAQRKVGLLDNRMFYGWEDTDYCIRMCKNGYKIFYYPDASVIHFEQRITNKRIFSRLFLENFKSMVYFFIKYPMGIMGRY